MQLVMRERDAARRAGARQTDNMLGTDVGREDGGPDQEPAEIAAGQEVVIRRVSVAPSNPPGDAEQHGEIQSDDDPIEAGHCAPRLHVADSLSRKAIRRCPMTLSRRNAPKLGLGAGAFALLPTPALTGAVHLAPRPAGEVGTVRARPLPLSAVRLTGGPLKHAQDLMAQYLLRLDADRMLAYYRERAGLTRKAEPYDGWDGGGRNLTGHIAGHHLSAVSLMFAATGDARFK